MTSFVFFCQDISECISASKDQQWQQLAIMSAAKASTPNNLNYVLCHMLCQNLLAAQTIAVHQCAKHHNPVCCKTLECLRAHPQAFITALGQGGDISLNPSHCLLAPKDLLLCLSLRFMSGYSRIWLRVRAFMRACGGDVRTPQSEEGSGWCANRHFASFFLPPLPTSPPSLLQSTVNPQSITFL